MENDNNNEIDNEKDNNDDDNNDDLVEIVANAFAQSIDVEKYRDMLELFNRLKDLEKEIKDTINTCNKLICKKGCGLFNCLSSGPKSPR